MPRVIKADHADFDITIDVTAVDSEGNVVKGSKLPEGFSLTLVSDNVDAFEVLPSTDNPLLFRAHVGGPTPEGDPNPANLVATLTDADGVVLATDAEAIVVTAGDPAAIKGITVNFPADIPNT